MSWLNKHGINNEIIPRKFGCHTFHVWQEREGFGTGSFDLVYNFRLLFFNHEKSCAKKA